ncbi:P-loop containing nucleoside triphosphate hydrolase protein [Gilbertella persicaria]|uniref:P-loop containing nucleoside triphosphate hydrolase protein n=1 Tax=Gilbertella persicaria TaxID=101096 RepID=UPI0022200B25|nr:P-loop containing nucleoside triphosphate hydrolase protein [Gilbertella persicaria]KAI8077390.1 P-loop containing nucleoside triphosphate hydrolase protein [Gilbertella persicaria]
MGFRRISSIQNSIAATKVCVEILSNSYISSRHIDLVKRRLYGYILKKGDQTEWNICGHKVLCKIVSVEGESNKTDRSTQYQFVQTRPCSAVTAEEQKDIYITSLIDMIRSSFDNSEAYHQLNIPVAKSILIHGVSGVGKTRLVKRVSEILSSVVYELSSHDLLCFNDEEYDLSEFENYNPLSLLTEKAISSAPSILILRDLDALTKQNARDKLKRILDVISQCVRKIGSSKIPIVLIGLARELKQLPDAFKKTDIFSQHMLLPIPSLPQRKLLLNHFLKNVKLGADGTEDKDTLNYYTTQISLRTSGYVARDLKLMVRQAKLKSMRSSDIADQLSKLNLSSSNCLQWQDFEYALETYRPSQRQSEQVESTLPKRDWNDLGGYRAIKDRMRQAILLPLLQPEVFRKLGIKPPSGLLLYGPSGCGKTALVQALVSESMMNVISIKGPEIFSKYLGETENKIRKLFATAKRISPCIVFIDEMDAIGTKRGFDMNDGESGGVNERVLSTLLNEMDGVEGRQGVVVIGCTNRPDQIDDAILRPGRLDQLIYVELPTLQDRIDIIKTIIKKVSASNDIDPEELAKQTEFCTGADLDNLFREAGTIALRKDLNAEYITDDHIQTVLISICERAENQVLEGNLDIYERLKHRQFK